MLLTVISLLLSFVMPSFQFPPFNGINQRSKVGNILEVQPLRTPHANDVVNCHTEDILNIITVEDILILIETLATRSAVSPLLILNKLYRRIRSRDGVKEVQINTLDGPLFTDIPPDTVMDFPPEVKIPLESSRAPYSLSPHASIIDDNKDESIVIVPVVPPVSRTPNSMKVGHTIRKEPTFLVNNMRPEDEEMSNMLPGVFLPPGKHNRLKPPLGATVRVNSGDPLNPITGDVIVAVSPLMTFIEVLRQAERKYQNALGLDDDSEIFTFTPLSTAMNCYIVDSIADVAQNEQYEWKITVTDRDSQIIYDSFCLPNNNEVLVKPGSVISLTYVPI